MPANAWTGKTAAICGGSDGLGYVLAQQLCAQSVGYLLLLARNEERLQRVRAELQQRFPKTEIACMAVDMSDRAQARLVAARCTTAPKLDLLVQAIGQSDRGTLQDLTKERMLELFDANLFTSLNAINELTKLMGSPSTVVLIGSLASHFAPRYLGGYAIAKHALAALAQQSRLELANQGVHVLLASPGPIARQDAGLRYQSLANRGNIPVEALQPGGGARIVGLNPQRLAADILQAAARRKILVIYPAKAGWLRLLATIFPRLGDQLLRRNSS